MITPEKIRHASEPDQFRQALDHFAEDLEKAGSGHKHHSATDVRTVRHRGHEIVVRTSYQITVDGIPFDIGLAVADDGHVHYHGLPTSGFASAVDLVRTAIDVFGVADVTGGASPAPPTGGRLGGHHGHLDVPHGGTG